MLKMATVCGIAKTCFQEV